MADNKNKNDVQELSFVQTRKTRLSKNHPQFQHDVIVDGDVAKALERADNPVVMHLFFAGYAVQCQAKITSKGLDKKHPKNDWTPKQCQEFSTGYRPAIGKQSDPIKRKERIFKSLKNNVHLMSKGEKEELKKMLA